jgi:cyclohexanone monooxygenase
MSELAKPSRDIRIAIIGAGPGGLCMAIKLKQAGFEDLTLLEQGPGVGGTWQHNLYPGCACDIPSHLYSFSFEIKRDWPRPYSPQSDILAYFESIARKYGLLAHCRFNDGVVSATWKEDDACWKVVTRSGDTLDADVVVSALGMFNELAWPEIPGLDSFGGTSFHSARWDWDHDLAGKSVGVIGSAASAVQFVPEIVKEAGRVHLFQRTANWVLPKSDMPYTEEELEHFRTDPNAALDLRTEIFNTVDAGITFSDPEALAKAEAVGLEAMNAVEDAETRRKLTPRHPFGCKRPLVSNDFYPAFNRPNLELITDPIERITENAILTADGREHFIDTLIFATGFSATRYLSAIDVTGRKGKGIRDAWADGAHAYLGITTSGFPNLFMLYGPNTNNGSILTMIEAQVDYALRQIERIAEEDLAWIDVRPEREARYNEELQTAIRGIDVWQADCNGYYRSPSGRVVTQWPYSMREFQRRTSESDAESFDSMPRSAYLSTGAAARRGHTT